jgi:integrase
MTLLKNAFGSIRPYTRHVNGCSKTDDSCNCPKWLYENRKGCDPRRYTLTTPSWAEAQRIAADKLRSFDPEIAAARASNDKRNASLKTVKEACDLWIARTEREYGKDAGALPQYRTLMKMLTEWARREHIEYVQDITPLQLEHWYSSAEWLRLADATRKQRWGVLRSMFAFLKRLHVLESNPIEGIRAAQIDGDHLQGPYTREQIDAIFAHIDATVPVSMELEERGVYAVRLRAFIKLLLHTGCDVIDAVLFDQARLADVQIDGNRIVPVYRYHREKTGVQAVIPLTGDVASILRSVPMLANNPAGMPFRDDRFKLPSDVHDWSRRIARVLDKAGVKYVELPRDKHGKARRKAANAKQFRHTFAVRQLERALRPEAVARQLGHVDATMVRKHYAPWVPELDESHIREILAAQ